MLSYLLFATLVASSQAGTQDPAVKGQKQIAGGGGEFGTTYSLKNGFNFAIVGARYSIDPFDAYSRVIPTKDEKLLILDIAVKNAQSEDAYFNIDSLFTLVDDKGQTYPGGSLMLESKGNKESGYTLRPGQGLGQPALKDPLHVAFNLPQTAKIAKIMVNVGRLNTSEEAIRYLLVAPPKPKAKATSPNWVAPLPDSVRTASDEYGAVALAEGKATLKSPVVSGQFRLSLDAIDSPADVQYNGEGPSDGKRFVVLTITATNIVTGDAPMFDAEGGGDTPYYVKDTDGETYAPRGFRKLKTDEDPDHAFVQGGGPYTFRAFFEVPKDAKIAKAAIGAANGRVWAYEVKG